MARPDRLRIPLDEHRFENVGRLPDGRQFVAYVTGTFLTGMKYYSGSDWRTRKRWLAGMHQFDADGNHLRSEVRLGASDIEGRQVAGDKAFAHRQGHVRRADGGRAAGVLGRLRAAVLHRDRRR